jgi:hypothetical protein
MANFGAYNTSTFHNIYIVIIFSTIFNMNMAQYNLIITNYKIIR